MCILRIIEASLKKFTDRCKKGKIATLIFSLACRLNFVAMFSDHPFSLRFLLPFVRLKKMQVCVNIKTMPTEKREGISFSSPISINSQFGFAVGSVGEITGILAVATFQARHLSLCFKMTKRWCKFGVNIWSSFPHIF